VNEIGDTLTEIEKHLEALGVEVGEVVVGDDLMSVVGQALVERSLGDQVSPHQPSFEETALGSNPSEHADLRGSGELRRCNSSRPVHRSRVPGPTFCRLT
jgi:hypothetical protein